MDIRSLLRPNIRSLKPYSSARDEFTGKASVYIDANENPYRLEFSRYPDPHQFVVKEKLAKIKGIDAKNIFLGNGSDEIIDLLIRAFCQPGMDSIITMDPSYGMYKVSADINDVEVIKVELNSDFTFDFDHFMGQSEASTKIAFLCSPNNPSGNIIPFKTMEKVVKTFKGIVVVDEAYIDFTTNKSMINLVDEYSNLVVLQTLSKAYGGASMRLGMGFANEEMISILNAIKPPYNISQPNQNEAIKRLNQYDDIQKYISLIVKERNKMELVLTSYKGIEKIHPSEANFLLVEVDDANKLYKFLMENGIIVRNRNGQTHCKNCIRITVGTPEENEILYQKLNIYYHAEDLVY